MITSSLSLTLHCTVMVVNVYTMLIIYNVICATTENSLRFAKSNLYFDMCLVLSAQHMSSVQEIHNPLFSDGFKKVHECIFDITDVY
jgi:hypothetical protein